MNEALKQFRKSKGKGWSQEKVAQKADIHRCMYVMVEGGRIPNLRTAYKIAKALNARVEDIFLPSDVLKEKHTQTEEEQ